ncbi:LemA family protein [Patescibacteria group bacterium]|nr:LemA family protein [Patescibacteria group bacterium]MBU1682474.1 LemA family protein [Patescibacteria group bacterium]MBU1935368.1 LemA family protein [Patescibacteria group bacterium]
MTLIIVIIVALILFVVLMYNSMIKLRNRVKEAWSDIDVQLKRRYNLIPNIVETVKGYATHEDKVFTKVTEARSKAINATNVKDQGAAENMLSGALKSLFAVAENYPDLKANENFLQLQNELVDTEDKIQSARRFYNGVTRDFNTKIQQFPNNLLANLFKFKAEEFFEIENEEQRENVKVSFKEPEKTPTDKEVGTQDLASEEGAKETTPTEEPLAEAEEEKKEEE